MYFRDQNAKNFSMIYAFWRAPGFTITDKTRDLENGIFLIPRVVKLYYVCAVEDIVEGRKERKVEGRIEKTYWNVVCMIKRGQKLKVPDGASEGHYH